ncbi:Oligosaccharyl transferase STT3 subunit [Flexistipes sinusarabici DSM 4947]|uniref:Oligosaccharyl transferase STT3 subunit n=1 Tax=Flexistipes sinusarabici (strain ATCC 49648 / DSM 4947 / MAS 10) TaxID=717231 RepID=F8E8K4_FLESM|nr:hypothetical protein [Flexistipes sinusarabici]AEI14053.1 Oligosaccharyl transferase STT3 subunit [Flexistipes sinusarabici DSM 4947]
MKKTLGIFILLLISSVIVFSISLYKRSQQFDKWQQNKDAYFVDNYTAMTTLDAYKWLRYARDKENGVAAEKEKDLRGYPDVRSYPDKIPYLSTLIATADNFFNSEGYDSIYVGGIKLSNILASLFIIPLIIYLYLAGGGFSGILGGLIGTFSWAYYVRASTGRVDTDGLVLLVPTLIGLLLLAVAISKKDIHRYIFAAVAGIAFIFLSEVHKVADAGMIGYFVILLLTLYLNKVPKKTILITAGIFVLFCNPLNFIFSVKTLYSFLASKYFFNVSEGGKGAEIVFPNILKTITETQQKNYMEILNMLYGNVYLAVLGLAGSVALFVIHFKRMLLLLPMLGLGCMAFVTSNRFSMFLSPFVGIGLGFIIYLAVKYAYKYALKRENSFVIHISSAAIMFIFFFLTTNFTAFSYIPRPSISAPITKSFIELKEKAPDNSAIFSWWDYGYALMDIGDFYTYHDGGLHGGSRTYFVGKAYTMDNQTKFYNMINYFDDKGFKSIKQMMDDNKSPEFMLNSVLDYSGELENNDNVYLLYTNDMIGKYGAISFFGNWDFQSKSSNNTGYQNLRCTSFRNNVLSCGNYTVNIPDGVLVAGNRRIPLRKVVFVNDGYVSKAQDYPYSEGVYVQILINQNRILGVQLLSESVYKSNFNQQYILGNYDKTYFEEVYNNFPVARAFKVKQGDVGKGILSD